MDPRLVALARAHRSGDESSKLALADLFIEMGYPAIAEEHFSGEKACHVGDEFCWVIKYLLGELDHLPEWLAFSDPPEAWDGIERRAREAVAGRLRNKILTADSSSPATASTEERR